MAATKRSEIAGMYAVVKRRNASTGGRRLLVAERKGGSQEASEEEAGSEKTLLKKIVFLGGLPQDLLVAVLARLPLRSLVQMRVLSTSFNAFLCSPPPFRLCCQLPWLVTVRVSDAGPGPDLRASKELTAYCPQLGTWFPFPSQGLCSAMGGPGLLQVLSVWSSSYSLRLSTLAMASLGGLICVVVTTLRPEAERRRAPPCQGMTNVEGYLSEYVFETEDFHLLVFDCFTGASKRLPPSPHSPTGAFSGFNVQPHMFLDTSAPGGAYYVVLEACVGSEFPVYDDLSIYSSRTGRWRVGHASSARPCPATLEDIVECDMVSYSYGLHPALLAYAVGSDSWLSFPIPDAELIGRWEYAFKWQGRVYLASSMEVDAGFTVSVLASSSSSQGSNTMGSWVKVATTPASLVQSPSTAGVYIGAYDVKYVLCGHLVCMTGSYTWHGGYHSNYLRPLVYDLVGDFWYFLPPPCIKGDTTTLDFGAGLLAFEPLLQATCYL